MFIYNGSYNICKMEKKIINLTPHWVTLILKTEEKTFLPEKESCRIKTTTKETSSLSIPYDKNDERFKFGSWADIPITETTFGKVENLPKEEEGIYYIVSSLVCQACTDRQDLLIPNESVRDEIGRICGCKSFSINPYYRG